MSHQTRPTRQLDEEKPPLIFISHDSRDRQLAQAFATLIRSVTSGKLKCFRSSDDSGTEGIEFGKGWFRSLEQQLDDATDVVCLLTERSVERPWILFEAGAARGRNLHGVVFGAHDISSSPFNCIQLCEAGEASVKMLSASNLAPVDRFNISRERLSAGRVLRWEVANDSVEQTH